MLKVAGEILLLAGRGDKAIPRLRMAAALLQAVKDVDVGHLIATGEQLLAFLGEPPTSTTATARALPREPQRPSPELEHDLEEVRVTACFAVRCRV